LLEKRLGQTVIQHGLLSDHVYAHIVISDFLEVKLRPGQKTPSVPWCANCKS